MHSQESGVVVTVITASPDTVGYGDTIELFALIDEMQRSGIYVRETDGEGEHYAVIDKKLTEEIAPEDMPPEEAT